VRPAAAACGPSAHLQGPAPRRDLSRFSRLESLSLAGNSIEHITGLGALARLERLNLQDNSIRSCRGLEGCSGLLQLGELLAGTACVRRLAALTAGRLCQAGMAALKPQPFAKVCLSATFQTWTATG
jgi:hypothetical protein